MSANALVLLNPGPACTSERVRGALVGDDMCPREVEFKDVLSSIRHTLPQALHVPGHETILITGSGTSAMEMAVISAVRADREILIVNNGVYGNRLKLIAQAHQIPVTEVSGDWFTPISVDQVAAALRANPKIDVVAAVHHETTTGMINPIKAIGDIASEAGVLFLVDSISGTAIEDQDLGDVAADFICGAANKGLHGLAGMAFILVSPRGIERLHEAPVRSLYLDAATYLEGNRTRSEPFTPAVQTCLAFDEAIREFTESGGFAARTQLYRDRAILVRAGFDKLGLHMPVAAEHRSNAVNLLGLPSGVTYLQLHDELKRRGYAIYAGQGKLASGYFRICTMGEISFETLERLLVDLEESIATLQG